MAGNVKMKLISPEFETMIYQKKRKDLRPQHVLPTRFFNKIIIFRGEVFETKLLFFSTVNKITEGLNSISRRGDRMDKEFATVTLFCCILRWSVRINRSVNPPRKYYNPFNRQLVYGYQ